MFPVEHRRHRGSISSPGVSSEWGTRSVPGAAVRERPNLLCEGDTWGNSATDLVHQQARRSQRRGVSGGRAGNTPCAPRQDGAAVPRGTPDWITVVGVPRGTLSRMSSSFGVEHVECSRSGRQGATVLARLRGHQGKLGDRYLPPTGSKLRTSRGKRRPRRERSACGRMAQSFHGKQTAPVKACSHGGKVQRGITFAIRPRSPSETAPTSSNPAGIDTFVQIQI